MGHIGPARQRYDVLPVPAMTADDADAQTATTSPQPLAEPERGTEPNPRRKRDRRD